MLAWCIRIASMRLTFSSVSISLILAWCLRFSSKCLSLSLSVSMSRCKTWCLRWYSRRLSRSWSDRASLNNLCLSRCFSWWIARSSGVYSHVSSYAQISHEKLMWSITSRHIQIKKIKYYFQINVVLVNKFILLRYLYVLEKTIFLLIYQCPFG